MDVNYVGNAKTEARERTLSERAENHEREFRQLATQTEERLAKLEAFMQRIYPDFVAAHMEPKTEGNTFSKIEVTSKY